MADHVFTEGEKKCLEQYWKECSKTPRKNLIKLVPLFFEKYFPVVTEGRPVFDGAELRIRTVRGQALRADCQSLYNTS